MFNPKPLEDFIAAHVQNPWRGDEAKAATFNVLESLIMRDYVFRPLVDGDLESIRADLETLLGMSVKAIRTFSIEEFLKRAPDESDEAYAERIDQEMDVLDAQFVDIENLLGWCDAWREWRVPETVADALWQAYDEVLNEPCADPVRDELVSRMLMSYVPLQGTVFLAAAAADDAVIQRLTPILRWLSRCMPIGGVRGEPGAIAIAVK